MTCECICCHVIGPSQAQRARDAERTAKVRARSDLQRIAELMERWRRSEMASAVAAYKRMDSLEAYLSGLTGDES